MKTKEQLEGEMVTGSVEAAVAPADTEEMSACRQEDRQGQRGRSRGSKPSAINMLHLHQGSGVGIKKITAGQAKSSKRSSLQPRH